VLVYRAAMHATEKMSLEPDRRQLRIRRFFACTMAPRHN
jgi:hypothetical protein